MVSTPSVCTGGATCLTNFIIRSVATPTLAKYALSLDTESDIFTPKWRPLLSALFCQLPAETRGCVDQELELLDLLQAHMQRLEARILERVEITRTLQWVMSVPGPAKIPWPAARAGCPS